MLGVRRVDLSWVQGDVRRRSRARRTLKWGGTASCLVLFGALVLSPTCRIEWATWPYGPASDEQQLVIGFHGGAFDVCKFGSIGGMGPPGWPGFSWYADWPWEWFWLPGASRFYGVAGSKLGVLIPLWLPLLLTLIPTIHLWYKDREPLPGCCVKCGYDLTGNTSGLCPECGEEITSDMASP